MLRIEAASDQERATLLAGKSANWPALVNLARAHATERFDKKDYDGALQAYRAVLAVALAAGDQPEQGRAWLKIGTCLNRKQDLLNALEAYGKARNVAASVGDAQTLADSLNALLKVEFALGKFSDAEQHARQALEVYTKLKDLRMIVGMKISIGTILGEEGDLESKVSMLKQALPEAEAGGFLEFQTNGLNNLGVAYADQGDYERAIQYLQRATDLSAKLYPDEHTRLAMFRVNLGSMHAQLGRPKEALEEYVKAEADARAVGNEAMVMGIRTDRGWLYQLQEKASLSLGQLRPLAAYYDKTPERAEAVKFFSVYEQTLLDTGDSNAAVAFAEKYLSETRAMGGPDLVRRTLEPLGEGYRRLGKREQARAVFLEAIAATESIKLTGGEDERGGFLHEKARPYLGMVAISNEEHKTFEALQFAERAKARLLLDVLRGGRAEINRLLSEAEKQRERELSSQIARMEIQLGRAGKEARTSLTTERDRLQGELAAFREELYRKYPELRIQRGEFRPLTSGQLSELLPDDATALVEYTMDRYNTYLFVVTRDAAGAPRIDSLELPSVGLAHQIEAFRTQLAGRDLRYRESARALYGRVFGTLVSRLAGKKRVVIVPDGALWELPFQALVTPRGKHMIEESSVFYAPSLTASREMKLLRRVQNDRSHTLLAFGAPAQSSVALPAMPESSREVREIGRLYGAESSAVFVGAQADKQRWISEAPRYRILHVATHGVLNSNNPLSSFLDLNRVPGDVQDSVLSAREILKMNLQAEITVLSACETARGLYRFGEGMIGMSWAFLIAGTPTTVVSQWKVDSTSTSQLMVAFHRHLLAQPVRRADALRAAALELLQSPQYRHPFYWAGFVMVGDGY